MNDASRSMAIDYSGNLHYPLGRRLNAVANSAPIPEEDVPLDALFTQIIRKGLTSLNGAPHPAKVVVVGAGPAGLCAAYELKRAGLSVTVLEASQRVGGRVKTIFEPFTPELHGEGGAMRLPADHILVHQYLDVFGLSDDLEPFDQANKIIYLSCYGKTLTYEDFYRLLKASDPDLLACFPGLKDSEKGKTIDDLWDEAIAPVNKEFEDVYKNNPNNITAAYARITELYDKYSLRTFFEQVANWSEACVSLYDLGSPHVVLGNAFIESWKDAFLSSQSGGESAGMMQMKQGMEQIPFAFIDPARKFTLKDDIRYGARVEAVKFDSKGNSVTVTYRGKNGELASESGDHVIFAVPFTAQRLIDVSPPFSIPKSNAIRDLRYVEVTKILLQFRTRWWEQYLSSLGQGKDGGVITDLPIRYAMFPPAGSAQYANGQNRGVIMASYTFQQDATETGANSDNAVVRLAARNLATIFGPELVYENLEVGTSQVWSADSFSGGSAFAYFGPMQKTRLWPTLVTPEWNGRAFFAGEQASYSHGWIEGAFESGLRVAHQLYVEQTLYC